MLIYEGVNKYVMDNVITLINAKGKISVKIMAKDNPISRHT